MKHSKEYWILVFITLFIPALVIAGMILFNLYLPELLNENQNATFSGDNVIFVLTNKLEGLTDNGTRIESIYYSFSNTTDFNALKLNQTYSCTKKTTWFDTNDSLSNCTEL
jgi:hypothetical protein